MVKQKLCPKCKGEMYDPHTYEMCDCDDGYIVIAYKEEKDDENTYLRQNAKNN